MPVQVRDSDVVWREVQGDIVILSLTDSAYFRLNSTGAFVWKRLTEDSGVEEDALVGALVDHYGIEQEQAADVVATFLSTLQQKGLITRA